MIGMVLAAGAGRRLQPLTDDLPKTLLPVDGDRTILDIALANLKHVGLEEIVVVTGFAAHRITDVKPELERRHGVSPRARVQPEGRGVEQRVLALVRARRAAPRAPCS